MMTFQDAVDMVAGFHNKHGMPVLDRPKLQTLDRLQLRERLTREEAEEAGDAINQLAHYREALRHCGVGMPSREDIHEELGHVAKELADQLFVIFGTALEFGIDIQRAFAVVCASNDTKIPGTEDNGGKVQKGPNYVAPTAEALLGEDAKGYRTGGFVFPQDIAQELEPTLRFPRCVDGAMRDHGRASWRRFQKVNELAPEDQKVKRLAGCMRLSASFIESCKLKSGDWIDFHADGKKRRLVMTSVDPEPRNPAADHMKTYNVGWKEVPWVGGKSPQDMVDL